MNPIETINRLTAETKLMNIIRQLIVMTQDVRPEDISKVCDNLNDLISDIGSKKQLRGSSLKGRPFNPFYIERRVPHRLDMKG